MKTRYMVKISRPSVSGEFWIDDDDKPIKEKDRARYFTSAMMADSVAAVVSGKYPEWRFHVIEVSYVVDLKQVKTYVGGKEVASVSAP